MIQAEAAEHKLAVRTESESSQIDLPILFNTLWQ
jgi:hypothetical protein